MCHICLALFGLCFTVSSANFVSKRLGLSNACLQSSKAHTATGFDDCVNLESLGRKSGYSGFDEDSGLNAPIVVNTSRLSKFCARGNSEFKQ